ncbi:N-acetylmuramoyl-L-alanine amidase [Arenibacter sp. A80]|jgi:N-acetylmuramoyl-L-alanine amidase|nr:N-acetylmuramoyl-L-alanine amidase [Arenibacter sp. A80]MCM4163842.1 N-acetylmuramoyl-L-alanine amidase [Arenibacter sp. A80]RFT56555.1 N-acetylmuramoyl-L-alanine amidase [Arenibacter sp. P308M17]
MVGLIGLPLASQTSVKTVIAERGDGIYSILRKQGMNPVRHYGHFVDLNQDNLRDSIHLYEGREYIIPQVPVDTVAIEESTIKKASEIKEVSHILNDDIFGKEYASTEIKSNKLQGAIYYLISGHGGPDPGAIEKYEDKIIAEDEYAYDITLRLAKELISHGAKTYIIIRDSNDGIRDQRLLEIDRDEVAYPNEDIPLNQLMRLKQRVDVVNKLYLENAGKYQRLLVTHVDSRSKGQNIDVFFYHHEKSKNGKRLAESIHETFLNKYRQYQPNRNYEGTFADRSGLYLVKNTLPAMAYIEVGNIKNKKDQKRILDPDNRQALAKWISEGVLLDFETRD